MEIYLIFIHLSILEAAKILAVFPAPSLSHQIVYRPLISELIKTHDVTVITTDPQYPKDKSPQNLTEIDIHEVSYKVLYKKLQEKNSSRVKTTFETASYVFEEQIRSKEVQSFLKLKEQFHLLMIEMCVHPALVFSYLFVAPVILISSFGGVFDVFESAGANYHPLLYPLPMRRRVYNLSILEKVIEFMHYFLEYSAFNKFEIWEDSMLRKVFGPEIPTLSELKKNVDMYFLNTHALWDSNRPVPPNVVYLGGIHLKTRSSYLPQSLQERLNSSIGALYLSFGTNVDPSLFPPEKIKIFVNVFSRLPYIVLWKWDKDELPGQSDNVITSKWFPQEALLHHNKIKLFITQGGLQSTDEAIYAGVPLLGIPLTGDQFYNTEKYEYFKIGSRLDFARLSEDNLLEAIKTLIDDQSCKKNIEDLRSVLYDKPQTSLTQAVWWINYVLRHKGAKHLIPAGSHISFIEYFELELVFFCIFCCLFMCFVFIIVYKSCRAMCNRFNNK